MTIECKHGQLARSCNICALEAELAEVTAQRDKLQELIDAPETEPVARVTGYYAGYLSIETIDGRVLPAGTAVYTSPPAPSVPDGWRQFLTDVITAAGLLKYGKRDKGLAGRIGKFAFDAMRAATTPAEPPAAVAEAVAAEREACAKICESVWDAWDAANEIRARGEKGQT